MFGGGRRGEGAVEEPARGGPGGRGGDNAGREGAGSTCRRG